MANYKYDSQLEVFKRTDNRGNHLAVNISEAQRIISLLDLGYSASKIQNKIRLSNPKASTSTLNSFIRNYVDGNIFMPDDAPAPVRSLESISDNDRINRLEERVIELEKKVDGMTSEDKGLVGKAKSWFNGV